MSSQDNSYSSTNEEIVRSLDAIKERVECHNAAYLSENSVCLCDEVLIANVPALVAAVEAVLELHKPEPEPNTMTWEGRYLCSQCVYMDDRGEPSAESYPCPTVTAIHQALGEE